VSDVRAAGRSIERIESLHSAYETLLRNYDTRLEAVASRSGSSGLSGSRAYFAFGMDVLLAALVVVGMAALFRSRQATEDESTA
jgi:hypothetical protein